MKPFFASLLAISLLFAPIRPVSGCPNCKEAVAAQPGDASRAADGFNRSILLMMAMPFALLGAGAFFVARAVKRGALPPL